MRGSTGFSARLLFGAGLRESVRHLDDRGRIFFVDRYSPTLFVGLLVGLSLSVLDGLLTLPLIGHGAYEVNPVMAYVLDISPSAFVASKYVLTCVSALVLMLRDVVVVRGKKLPPHVLLYLFVGGFALVVAWEIYLISIVAT